MIFTLAYGHIRSSPPGCYFCSVGRPLTPARSFHTQHSSLRNCGTASLDVLHASRCYRDLIIVIVLHLSQWPEPYPLEASVSSAGGETW